ncbi:hypothetical protein D0T12_31545 [Actinomadura spongiicola]|uniref:Uncharacterized protein n=1 Tax=Actinomadura spongiicola TaxID=2303421 RepID=A0A372G7V9_9ACTN|nr:hypothetical protein [Actinomadura spongiicola]RFS81484.1 hypothetical protein D0T12_31545 [Actinomadura spongiicola]
MTVGKFFARCRLAYRDDTSQMRLCDTKFDLRAEFVEHMADVHGRTQPRTPGQTPKARTWRRPQRTRKLYEPKEYGVGAWVTFTESRDDKIVLRRGQIWSLGPPRIGNSRWVVPDDDGDAVVVRINQRPVLTSQTLLDVVPGHNMHRQNLRRAENLRRFGRLFPVVVSKHWEYLWLTGKTLVESWCWHVDPMCPDAVGRAAPSKQFQPFNITQVVLELISGRINASTSRFCRRCFWLDDTNDTAA